MSQGKVSTQRLLLTLLADGQWHSGESLGAALNISRAAISKQIKQIQTLGLELETLKGVGYRAEPFELLSADKIQAEFDASAARQLGQLKVFDSLPSTNQYLLDQFREGQSIRGDFCVAEQQTQGRGRRGRSWHSPFARNLYLSVGWSFDGGVAEIEGLSLAVGVAICEVLESLGFNRAQLKWPNDILVGHKKLGGVLIELGGDATGNCSVVVGVGLNVHMVSEVKGDINQPWTSLANERAAIGRNIIAGRLGSALLSLLSEYADRGFVNYRERWSRHAAFVGEQVELSSASQTTVGVLLGVGAKGELQIKVNDEIQTFLGGEVSLRVAR